MFNKIIACFLATLSLSACSNDTIEKEGFTAKTIIFLAQTKTFGGKGVPAMYNEAKQMGHDVKVAITPYFYFGDKLNDADLEFAKEFKSKDVIYPCGKKPPYKKCTSLKSYKPDYIFIQNPYNTATRSVLEKHYSISALQKISKLIYVVYGPHLFHQDTINDTKLPEMVDTVFVDSESTKSIYVTKYNFPEHRVAVAGYQPYKDVRDLLQKRSTKKQETILYMPRWVLNFRNRHLHEGGSTFLNYHYFFYNYATANPNTQFIIRPHAFLERSAIEEQHLSKADIDEIFKRLSSLKNVRFSEHNSNSLVDDVLESDIVISDGSSALGEVIVANKPIIYLSNGANIEFESNDLSKQLVKNVYMAYSPTDIIKHINTARKNQYNPDKKFKEMKKFKKDLDPVENPAKHIALYLGNQ